MGKKPLTFTELPTPLLNSHSTGSFRRHALPASQTIFWPGVGRFGLIVLLSLVFSNPFTPDSGWAQGSHRNPVSTAALGVTSLLATIPYGATKLLYAGLGAVVGGFSYILTLGNTDTAETIWEKSLLGTYVLSPEHLTGEEAIHFVGP